MYLHENIQHAVFEELITRGVPPLPLNGEKRQMARA